MTDYTPQSWAQALLAKLGLPTTSSNVTAITAWEAAEGGHWNDPDKYNPLNTTQSAPGAVATNSAGVKSYTSWDEGLTATVQTLTNGMYAGILSALKGGSSAQSVVSAVVSSPWGTKNISLSGANYNPSTVPDSGTATDASVASDAVSGIGSWMQSQAVRFTVIGGGIILVVLGALRGTHAVARVNAKGYQAAAMIPEGAALESAGIGG